MYLNERYLIYDRYLNKSWLGGEFSLLGLPQTDDLENPNRSEPILVSSMSPSALLFKDSGEDGSKVISLPKKRSSLAPAERKQPVAGDLILVQQPSKQSYWRSTMAESRSPILSSKLCQHRPAANRRKRVPQPPYCSPA